MHFPQHIAVIPDGNRTRAKDQGLSVVDGYIKSIDVSTQLIKHAFSTTPLKVFTGWGLSTENVAQRPKEELDSLFGFYKKSWSDLDDFLREQQINFKRVGIEKGLPGDFIEFLRKKEAEFHFDTERTLVFAINYGGRSEIIEGIKNRQQKDGNTETLTEESFGKYLPFGDLPPIDLVIRTKGQRAKRTSGFMSRRIGYAELYFTNIYYPAFTNQNLDDAFKWFDSIAEQRNFGK